MSQNLRVIFFQKMDKLKHKQLQVLKFNTNFYINWELKPNNLILNLFPVL